MEGTLNKFLKEFFLLSARQKLCFLNGGCDTCLTKERSMPVRIREHVPSLTRYVGEKLYVDLVSMSDKTRRNRYLLTAEDSLSRYYQAYLIPNKKEHTVAKVLMDKHFKVHVSPDQLHSDNCKEFVNNLLRELFSEFKIQHTTTTLYNPSSNLVERSQGQLLVCYRQGDPE